jgi:hypothetical protein
VSWNVFAGLVLSFVALRVATAAQTPANPQEAAIAAAPKPEDAVPAILSLFDKYEVVGMNSAHQMKDLDDFILSLIRNPEFPNVVNDIVVECGNALYQPILDRYISGEDVSISEARQVWRNTTQPMCSVSAFYEQIFPLVRRINQKLPPVKRLRVLAGDPPIDWTRVRSQSDITAFLEGRDVSIVAVMEKEVFAKRRKALMLFGIAHLVHGLQVNPALSNFAIPPGAVARYEKDRPDVTFVIEVGPALGCGTSALTDNAALARMSSSWPVPSLVRTKGTKLPNTILIDAYLYLGPQDLLLSEPRPADVFVDTELMRELRRRAALMPGPINDQIDPDKVREQDASPFRFCR